MTDRVIPLADWRQSALRVAVPAHPVTPDGRLQDRLHRPLHDLRISVTDRCNFRCTYCMPKEVFDKHHVFLPHEQLLSFEEITRLAGLFVAHGVRKIRLTGGEPLLRRHLERLIESLAALRTVEGKPLDLTLTTNGSILARKAQGLRDAGLNRITVSLDAIDDAIFRRMNDADFPVADVLAGIDAAERAGLGPIKVNMVVRRGVNDGEVLAMARHFRGRPIALRFIEYMDVGATNGWRMDDVVSAREIVERIGEHMPLVPVDPHYRGEVAERWRYVDGPGEIGVIASVTQAFCRDCTRARLSTEGRLFTCLFANEGFDLREIVRAGTDDGALRRVVAALWRQRADRYSEIRTAGTAAAPKVEMSYIGG